MAPLTQWRRVVLTAMPARVYIILKNKLSAEKRSPQYCWHLLTLNDQTFGPHRVFNIHREYEHAPIRCVAVPWWRPKNLTGLNYWSPKNQSATAPIYTCSILEPLLYAMGSQPFQPWGNPSGFWKVLRNPTCIGFHPFQPDMHSKRSMQAQGTSKMPKFK